MQSVKQKRINKKIIFSTIAVVVIILVTCGSYLWLHRSPAPKKSNINKASTSSVNYNPATSEQKAEGSSIKGDSVDSSNPSDTVATQSTAPTSGATTNKTSVVVTIPSANQLATTYQITSQIDTVTSSGTCTLTLTKPGATTVIMTAPVQAQATISTCEGFSVPLSKLSTGTWQVSLQFENTTYSGSAATTIEVK